MTDERNDTGEEEPTRESNDGRPDDGPGGQPTKVRGDSTDDPFDDQDDYNQGQPGGQGGYDQGQPGGQDDYGGQGGYNRGQQGQQGRTYQQSPGTQQSTESSGTGLESNIAGAIAYLFAPLAGIVMYVLEGDSDDFVRFHSLQAIAFGVALIGLYLVVAVLQFAGTFILSDIPFIGTLWGLVTLLLWPLLSLVGFALWVFLTYKAYQGERYQLPVLGSFAASR